MGVIIAVNLVIFLGPETGYETPIDELFQLNPVLGVVVVTVLVVSPVAGIWLIGLRRRRSVRAQRTPPATL